MSWTKKVFLLLGILGLGLFFLPNPEKNEQIQIFRGPRQTALGKSLAVRLLILRHSAGGMAQGDANLAAQAAEHAKSQGLNVQVIGDQLVESIQDFDTAVNAHINKSATAGDTLIIHTIGHGFTSGGLDNLGQRSGVVKVLAQAAEKNKQEILWWQLSCHAAASLPGIETLNEAQQWLLSILASSSASDTSSTDVQARIMKEVLSAIANDDQQIDPNKDDMITASELKGFLNGLDEASRGDLLFARSPDEPIFGRLFKPSDLPIVDLDSPGRQFSRDYIPLP